MAMSWVKASRGVPRRFGTRRTGSDAGSTRDGVGAAPFVARALGVLGAAGAGAARVVPVPVVAAGVVAARVGPVGVGAAEVGPVRVGPAGVGARGAAPLGRGPGSAGGSGPVRAIAGPGAGSKATRADSTWGGLFSRSVG